MNLPNKLCLLFAFSQYKLTRIQIKKLNYLSNKPKHINLKHDKKSPNSSTPNTQSKIHTDILPKPPYFTNLQSLHFQYFSQFS